MELHIPLVIIYMNFVLYDIHVQYVVSTYDMINRLLGCRAILLLQDPHLQITQTSYPSFLATNADFG